MAKAQTSTPKEGTLVVVEAARDFYGVEKGERKKVIYGQLVRKMVELKNWKIVEEK